MTNATELLLGDECYHWHSKLTVKPPKSDVHIDWHQDFGSWYDDGVLSPDLLTIGIAVEPAHIANGFHRTFRSHAGMHHIEITIITNCTTNI